MAFGWELQRGGHERAASTADMLQHAWVTALKKVQDELGSDLLGTPEMQNKQTCMAAINRLSQNLTAMSPTISKCIGLLETFDRAISNFCQSNSEVSCLIWGGFHTILALIKKDSHCLDEIAEMLGEFAITEPELQRYIIIYSRDSTLLQLIIDIYCVFMVFCAQAHKYLTAKKPYSFLLATWYQQGKNLTELKGRFRSLLEEIRRQTAINNMAVTKESHKLIQQMKAQLAPPEMHSGMNRMHSESITMLPHMHNATFVGRTAEIAKLESDLAPAPDNSAAPRIASISGPPGMGKTQLALQLAYRNTAQYRGRFWIRAETKEAVQDGLSKIGMKLVPETPRDYLGFLEKKVRDAVECMQETTYSWLLVVENATDQATIEAFLPKVGRGSILITTQNRVGFQIVPRSQSVELVGLDMESAVQWLHEKIPDVVDKTLHLQTPDSMNVEDYAIYQVLQESEYHPLIMTHMGNYIHETKCKASWYRDMLQKNSEHVYTDGTHTGPGYNRTIASCCEMSMSHLDKQALYVYCIMALFQVDAIHEELITKGCSGVAELAHVADKPTWNNTVGLFNRHFLATVIPARDGRSTRTLQIPPLFQQHVMHILQDTNKVKTALYDATALLGAIFPRRPADGRTMFTSWTECERWLPHVLSLKKSVECAEAAKKVDYTDLRAYAELLCNCAWYMWERGIVDAIDFAEYGLRVCCKVCRYKGKSYHEVNPVERVVYDTLLSDMYTLVGALQVPSFTHRYSCSDAFLQALFILQKIVDQHQNHGTEVPFHTSLLLANAYNNAGAGYVSMDVENKSDLAKTMYGRALELKRQLGNEERMPYEFAIARYNQSRLTFDRGDADGALAGGQRSLELVKLACGADHNRTLQFSYTVAEILMAVGRHEEGLALHEKTQNQRLIVLGVMNSDTAMSYYGLSCAYQKLGRFNEAVMAANVALEIYGTQNNAKGRIARAHFRKKTIYDIWGGHAEEAAAAHAMAQQYRMELLKVEPNMVATGETMEDYDKLVSY